MNIIKSFSKQAIPASFSCLFCYMVETVNMVMIGQLNDPVKLAGVGMGNVFINMFGVSQYFGLNSSLEILVSQAKGSKNLELCGIYLQRGRIIAMFYYIFIIIVYTSSVHIIRALK